MRAPCTCLDPQLGRLLNEECWYSRGTKDLDQEHKKIKSIHGFPSWIADGETAQRLRNNIQQEKPKHTSLTKVVKVRTRMKSAALDKTYSKKKNAQPTSLPEAINIAPALA